MYDGSSERVHSAMCARLMRLFPRVSRGMRRQHDDAFADDGLGPRHVLALEQLRGGGLTVGALAAELDLTLPTVSGVLNDLERARLVTRQTDEADRRRIIVAISEGKRADVERWLDGMAAPLARVLNLLADDERAAFCKAMDLLDAELQVRDSPDRR